MYKYFTGFNPQHAKFTNQQVTVPHYYKPVLLLHSTPLSHTWMSQFYIQTPIPQLNEPVLQTIHYPTTEWASLSYNPYPIDEWACFTYNPLILHLNKPVLHTIPYPTTEWDSFTYNPLSHNWMSQFYI